MKDTMTQVFISYSRKDIAFVEQLADDLKIAGFDAWYDLSGLEGGSRWNEEIERAIKTSQYFVVVLSPDSIDSIWVKEEIFYAFNLKTKIVPLMYRPCVVPLGLNTVNFINVQEKNYQKNYKEILRALGLGRSEREEAERIFLEGLQGQKESNVKSEIGKKEDKFLPVKPKLEWKIVYWLIGITVITIGSIFLYFTNRYLNTVEPTPEDGQTQVINTSTSTKTAEPTATHTHTVTPSPTMGIGSTMIGVDGMTLLYVPAGDFKMGSNDQASDYSSDNYPQFDYYLDSFWIDQTEVTNQQYAMCVSDGKCKLPLLLNSPRRSSYYLDTRYEDFPVIYVEWGMARAYCEWAGRRLPTESEWEKSARGTDGRIYPWGNDEPISNFLLNFNNYGGDTSVVRSFSRGKSPYGAYDMAGDVCEWTSSLYMLYPYESDDGREDLLATRERVLRGGSWYFNPDNKGMSIFRYGVISDPNYLVRSDVRSFASQDGMGPTSPEGLGIVGFRCAKDAP